MVFDIKEQNIRGNVIQSDEFDSITVYKDFCDGVKNHDIMFIK